MRKLKMSVESLRVEAFTPSETVAERGTVRGHSGSLSCLPSYCSTECFPYCATGSWQCETANTCISAGDCCKPTMDNTPCEM